MEFNITCSSDGDVFAVTCSGSGTRPGVKPVELERWLRALGASDATISNVLNIGASHSITIDVEEASDNSFMRREKAS